MMAEPEDRYIVPALARGLQLLAQFKRNEREISGAELSRRLELPRASVFRMLQTLEQMGFVERAGANYKLGIGILRLGFEYLASMELTEHGGPVIDALRDASGFSAHLVVRDVRDVVFVAKAPGRGAFLQSVQVGARLPAHATVLGRLLLANLSLEQLRALYDGIELTRFTNQTPTTVAHLKALIDAAASAGYGISQGGFEAGISTIAAPVLNERHEVVAAVSITVPAQTVAPEQASRLIAQVRDAAAGLTGRISHLEEPRQAPLKVHRLEKRRA